MNDEHLMKNSIKWIFCPPGVSHMGSSLEHQIRKVTSQMLLAQNSACDEESFLKLFVRLRHLEIKAIDYYIFGL